MTNALSDVSETDQSSADAGPIWARFDEEWYLAHYPEAARGVANGDFVSGYQFYSEVGQGAGHGPNCYFDELWYRQSYPDIADAIRNGDIPSGFADYLTSGFQSRSPHWLFDPFFYARQCAGAGILLDGSDLYGHFLTQGTAGGLTGHAFFDPDLVAQALSALERSPADGNLFGSWLRLPSDLRDSYRASWYFDPVWYLERFPDVAADIARGRYCSGLHHYLSNETPCEFDPQASFTEAAYLQRHSDILPSIHNGTFRNGYDHFVRFGALEGRAPSDEIDLLEYGRRALVDADLRSGRFADPFAHMVWADTSGLREWYCVTPPQEHQTKEAFRADAALTERVTVGRPLDFTAQLPVVSVILIAHDQAELTLQSLASLRENFAGPIDLIVVDSGSRDAIRQIERYVIGARILRFPTNIGYLDGCNEALAHARAEAVLFFNNDVRLYPRALDNALARLASDPEIGAVGAKLIRSNLRLQEAGSIVWRDGATYGYRREDDPNLAEANFLRAVNYCSAAFLLIRTAILRTLGGFDARYRPAYFEDTDLCVRLIQAGSTIIYDPTVAVEHLEFGSSGTIRSQAMIKANHRLFGSVHQDYLRFQPPRHVRNAVLAREARRERRRILYIEDRIPLPALGSGYTRSNDVVRTMSCIGYQVTVFPILPRRTSLTEVFNNFPDDVEVLYQQELSGLYEFIAERAGYYDAIWIGRTHNMERLLPILSEAARHLPAGGAVLDTEVVATPRDFERARVLGKPLDPSSFEDRLRDELDSAHFCQQIVAVTEADAAFIRQVGYDNVSVLGHGVAARPSAGNFAERRDFLLVGAMHDVGSPNHDGLLWLVRDVMPYLDTMLPDDVRISIVGHLGADIDPAPVVAASRRINWIGSQKHLGPIYNAHRVFVAPTRFAGGLPYKVHEAASFGIPIVTTDLIAQQVGWNSGEALLSARSDDPEAFARAMVRVYSDEGLWNQLRSGASCHLALECSQKKFQDDLDAILRKCVN